MKMKNVLIAMCALVSASLLFAGSMAATAAVSDSGMGAKIAVPPTPIAGCQGYSVVPVGGEVTMGAYSARLADLAVSTGAANSHPAIVDILDQNGAVIDRVQIASGGSYVYDGTSADVRISVCQTAPGFTLNAKWAKMRIEATSAQPSNPCAGYGTVDIGNAMAIGGTNLLLSDISIATGQDNSHKAIVDVLDYTNAVIGQTQIAPGETKVVQGFNGSNIQVSVCQTAPGFTLNAKWAKMKAVPTSALVTQNCANAPFTVTKQGIVNVGGVIDNGQYKVRLSDISIENEVGKKHAAIVDIMDSNDALLDSAAIDSGTTYVYTGTGGAPLKIYICQTAPGYTLNAKWADIKMGN